MDGFLLIDKEIGVSSFDVVKRVRSLTREPHVGHAGTLDPLATGLLVVAIGEATKLLEYFIGCDKEYEVSACFGKVSDTYDSDGKITIVDGKAYHDSEEIVSVIKQKFIGEIEQIPPQYSAIKVKGKRAYEIARKGGSVELKARKVNILRFDLREFDWPVVSFRVKCGSGTYIRSLIHDLGRELGCGAYVTKLRRTKVDNFPVEMSCEVEKLAERIDKIDKYLISLEDLGKKFKRIDLTDEEYEALKNGRTLLSKKVDQLTDADEVFVAYCNDFLTGVVEVDKSGKGIKFRKMIVR
ncbi:MAG: tRNA pseudouridine(55) synthase TruB [Candidatus Gracilibacteria bacterium]|jgi:tRNA pseudouridine55 synthase